MERLIAGLTEAINYVTINQEYLWVGVIECKTAKKYKFEVFWFYGNENYDHEETIEDQISHAETRMCTDLKQAYAYGFDAIKKRLEAYPLTRISITDLTKTNEEG